MRSDPASWPIQLAMCATLAGALLIAAAVKHQIARPAKVIVDWPATQPASVPTEPEGAVCPNGVNDAVDR